MTEGLEINTSQVILTAIEASVRARVLQMLAQLGGRRDRVACDNVFGCFTWSIVEPYRLLNIASRAAWFAREELIPCVLKYEKETGKELHKGALFYDTALTHLFAGDEARFEWFLSMADEEDNLTNQVEGKNKSSRGTTNLKNGPLSRQTLQMTLDFVADLLNGSATGQAITLRTFSGLQLTLSV